MIKQIYICINAGKLRTKTIRFAEKQFSSLKPSLIDKFSSLTEEINKGKEGLIFLDELFLSNNDLQLVDLKELLTGCESGVILIVSTADLTADGHSAFAHKPIDIIATDSYDEKCLLSFIRVCYQNMIASINGSEISISDLVNINTDEIRFRMNVFDAINCTSDGLWLWNIDEKTLQLSNKFRKSLGYSNKQLPDDLEKFIKIIHPEDRKQFRLTLEKYFQKQERDFSIELRLRCQSREYNWFLLKGYACWNNSGLPQQLLGVQININEMKRRMELLENIALHDPLTDLPNRNLLYDRLRNIMASRERSHRMLGLIFIDLDKFKSINDNYGHKTGDMVLKETAARILKCVRKSDTVARLYGDEFIVVVPYIKSVEDMSIFTKRIEAAFKQPMTVGDLKFNMSCSIGTSIYPQDGNTVEDLLEKADLSMYKRKNIYRSLFRNNKTER